MDNLPPVSILDPIEKLTGGVMGEVRGIIWLVGLAGLVWVIWQWEQGWRVKVGAPAKTMVERALRPRVKLRAALHQLIRNCGINVWGNYQVSAYVSSLKLIGIDPCFRRPRWQLWNRGTEGVVANSLRWHAATVIAPAMASLLRKLK